MTLLMAVLQFARKVTPNIL